MKILLTFDVQYLFLKKCTTENIFVFYFMETFDCKIHKYVFIFNREAIANDVNTDADTFDILNSQN